MTAMAQNLLVNMGWHDSAHLTLHLAPMPATLTGDDTRSSRVVLTTRERRAEHGTIAAILPNRIAEFAVAFSAFFRAACSVVLDAVVLRASIILRRCTEKIRCNGWRCVREDGSCLNQIRFISGNSGLSLTMLGAHTKLHQ